MVSFLAKVTEEVARVVQSGQRVFDFQTDLDHVAEAYWAMDERRAIKSLLRIGTV
jgi:hypothetical protein